MLPKECLDRILSIVCNVFDAYSVVLFLPDEAGTDYYLASGFSLGDHLLRGVRLQPGQGLVGWVLRDNKPMLLNNFDRQGDSLGYYGPGAEAKIKAFMGISLGEGQGALCLDSKKTYSFSVKDEKILHQFGQFIRTFMTGMCQMDSGTRETSYYQFIRLMHIYRRKHSKWSVFLKHFLELFAETTGFRYCLLAVRDEVGKGYYLEGCNVRFISHFQSGSEKFDMGAGLIGWVFKNDQPLFSSEREDAIAGGSALFGRNVQTQPVRTAICLPLDVHRRTRGVLVAAHEDSVSISDDLKAFCLMVAENLALFLENLYLKNRLAQAKVKQ